MRQFTMPARLAASIALVTTLALLAAMSAGATAAASGQLTVVGPWQGANEQSFRAVLDGFHTQHPDVTVTYRAVAGSVAQAIGTAGSAKDADVAVLSLPGDQAAMRTLARNGTIKPIEFVVPALQASYAFTWKVLGSTDGKLVGLPFKASNESGFWYDDALFRARKLHVPTTWNGLQHLLANVGSSARPPLAIGASSGFLLPQLFQNVYLMQQGSRRFDALARGDIAWNSPTVRDAMTLLRSGLVAPGRVAGGLGSGLDSPFQGAVQKVFGSPQRASMVPGGSAVYPVLYSAKAVRPITQFGVVPFPSMNGIGPARVIGTADLAVMLEDTPTARSLISYLATPQAAAIWARRGGDFLSPNRKLSLQSYPVAGMRTLAGALAGTNVFRLSLTGTMPPAFQKTLNQALLDYVRSPSQLRQITTQLAAVAPKA